MRSDGNRLAEAVNRLPLAAGDELVMIREYRHDPSAQRRCQFTIASVPAKPPAARAAAGCPLHVNRVLRHLVHNPGLSARPLLPHTGGHTEGIVAIRTLKVRRRELPEIEIISI